jgi:hypothetical protein
MAMTTISSMRVKAPLARDAECRMPNIEGMTKPEERMRARFLSSFVIRISSFALRASRLLLQTADDADERREESEYNGTDNKRQKYNHNRLEHRRDRRHRVIDLVVINIGNL